jgi:DNA-directed RNA polymerase subunit RPC12/RpoP
MPHCEFICPDCHKAFLKTVSQEDYEEGKIACPHCTVAATEWTFMWHCLSGHEEEGLTELGKPSGGELRPALAGRRASFGALSHDERLWPMARSAINLGTLLWMNRSIATHDSSSS